MQLVEWRDDFRTGIPSIDFEHEHLIALINDLHQEAQNASGKAGIEAALGDIHAAVSSHFALEEKIMRDIGYELYGAHKAEHDQLLDEIREIMEQVHADRSFDYRSTLKNQLRDWFAIHFRGADARLHRLTDG